MVGKLVLDTWNASGLFLECGVEFGVAIKKQRGLGMQFDGVVLA